MLEMRIRISSQIKNQEKNIARRGHSGERLDSRRHGRGTARRPACVLVVHLHRRRAVERKAIEADCGDSFESRICLPTLATDLGVFEIQGGRCGCCLSQYRFRRCTPCSYLACPTSGERPTRRNQAGAGSLRRASRCPSRRRGHQCKPQLFYSVRKNQKTDMSRVGEQALIRSMIYCAVCGITMLSAQHDETFMWERRARTVDRSMYHAASSRSFRRFLARKRLSRI